MASSGGAGRRGGWDGAQHRQGSGGDAAGFAGGGALIAADALIVVDQNAGHVSVPRLDHLR
jgi:hypothetical protein